MSHTDRILHTLHLLAPAITFSVVRFGGRPAARASTCYSEVTTPIALWRTTERALLLSVEGLAELPLDNAAAAQLPAAHRYLETVVGEVPVTLPGGFAVA